MADNKPTHRLLIAYKREDRNGNTKDAYHEVCALWPTSKGGFSGEIPNGMSISGRIVIASADKPDAADQGGTGDGLSDH